MKRTMIACSLFLALAAQGRAEATRALLTQENKFPELYQAEAGLLLQHREFDLRDIDSAALQLRYGLVENLTLRAEVPYLNVNNDEPLDDESGIGDIKLGMDLLAYQDIFKYPYVIPHVDVQLETGDDQKGTGFGETVTTFGVSIGTTVYDVLHYVVDISYALNGGTESPNRDNLVLFSGSLIWDVGDRFAVLVEGRTTDEGSADDRPYLLQGGMVYKATDDLQISWYGGGWSQSDEDLVASMRATYSF